MKKTVFLLTGSLLFALVLQAQQNRSRFLADLSFGPSVPVGKFADRSYGDLNKQQPPGLAKTGLAVNFSVGYYLNKSMGVLLSAGYSVHEQDWSKYPEYLRTRLFINTVPGYEVRANSWKTVNVMGGGFFNVPLRADHKLNLLTKLSAGVCKTAVPGSHWKYYRLDGTWEESTEEKIDLSWGFCYQASIALQYKLTDRLHVLLDLNSFNAIPQKDFSLDPYATNYEGKITRRYNLNTVNAMAGIGVNF